VLEIARERKYELYDLFLEMPAPLVPRPWRRPAEGAASAPMARSSDRTGRGCGSGWRRGALVAEQGVDEPRHLLPACLRQSRARTADLAPRNAIARALPGFVGVAVVGSSSPEIREYLRAW
jgi:N-methylhydantoinase A